MSQSEAFGPLDSSITKDHGPKIHLRIIIIIIKVLPLHEFNFSISISSGPSPCSIHALFDFSLFLRELLTCIEKMSLHRLTLMGCVETEVCLVIFYGSHEVCLVKNPKPNITEK